MVRVDEQAFGNVILGRARYEDAVDAGQIKLDGPPALVKAFPTWLYNTRYSKYARPIPARQTAIGDALPALGA